MKWLLCSSLALAACQSGEAKTTSATGATQAGTTIIQLPKAQVTEEYRADITTLCDVVRLSGADQKPKDEQWTITAMYLGRLKQEGHDLLVAIQPLAGEAKALALETEAKRVGLASCALAQDWREASKRQP